MIKVIQRDGVKIQVTLITNEQKDKWLEDHTIEINGRGKFYYTPYQINGALEDAFGLYYKGYFRPDLRKTPDILVYHRVVDELVGRWLLMRLYE